MPATPLNDLERAMLAAQRSAAEQPEFFRRLRADPVWFLMPYHPEFEGVESLGLEAQISLSCWTRKDEQVVPLFTSFERIEECWKKRKLPEKLHVFGQLEGVRLLQMIASQKMPVALNPLSSIGEAYFAADLVAGLADGSMLAPVRCSNGVKETAVMTILDPAEYPTDLVQPIFGYLKKHPNFRAAWLFGEGGPKQRENGVYRLVVWMEPRDEQLEQDLAVVIRAADRDDMQCRVAIIDAEEVAAQEWTRHVPAFYSAPGTSLGESNREPL